MAFILCPLITLVARTLWLTAIRKLKLNSIIFRPIARFSGIATWVFGVLTVVQCKFFPVKA